jgi:N-terminal domain on NACHT_NTPase and P-loop NTPases
MHIALFSLMMPWKMIGYTSNKGNFNEEGVFDDTKIEQTVVMEAIAAGSSIIAFIQITASTCSAVNDVVRRFRDAPEEFHQLARQLALLESELNFINNLQGNAIDDDLALLPNETEDLSKALEAAQALILEVRRSCHKYKQDGKPGAPALIRGTHNYYYS